MTEIEMACKDTVTKTLDLLKAHPDWDRRYEEYAARILIHLPFIKEACKAVKSKLKDTFTLHLSTTEAMESLYEVNFDVRYLGQKVMDVIYNNEDGLKMTTKGLDEANADWFYCTTTLKDCGWDSAESKEFLEHFISGKAGETPHSKELKIQGQVIKEMAKTKSTEKHPALIGVQPVMLGEAMFMMKTAISASNSGNIKFGESGGFGGGVGGNIDLLMRSGVGASNKLCVVEFKREYENVKGALQQGTAYATFLRELLRSKAGPSWWKIFGYTQYIPEPGKLNLLVAIAMPKPKKGKPDTSFGDDKKIEMQIEGDTIALHYIYFKVNEEERKVEDFISSLPKVKLNKDAEHGLD